MNDQERMRTFQIQKNGVFYKSLKIYTKIYIEVKKTLRYADDTTLLAESEEELKSLLKVKEESGGESERGPNQFGRKNEVVFSRWSGNDRHKHFKL